MKKNLLTLLVLVAVSLMTVKAGVMISGKIVNPHTKKVVIELPDKKEKYEVFLDRNNSFSIILTLTAPSQATFIHGKEKTALFIEPKDNIVVNFDARRFYETLSYSGKGAEKYNYLAHYYLKFKLLTDYEATESAIASSTFHSYLGYFDDSIKKELEYLKENSSKFSPAFFNYAYREINFMAALYKYNFSL